MSYDPADVFLGAILSLGRRLLLFASSVWVGCSTAAVALVVIHCLHYKTIPPDMMLVVLLSPLLLINEWLPVEFAVLVIGFAYSVRTERPEYVSWTALATAVSLVVMLALTGYPSKHWISLTAGWLFWAVEICMMGTMVWLLWRHLSHNASRHLMAVSIETSVRQQEDKIRIRERVEASRPPASPAPAMTVAPSSALLKLQSGRGASANDLARES